MFSLLSKNNEEEAKKIMSKTPLVLIIIGRIYYEEDIPNVIKYIRDTN